MLSPTTLEKFTLLKFVQVFILSGLLIGLSPDAQARRAKHSYTNDYNDDSEQSLSTAPVKTPVDLEICFSPDEPCEAKLVKFVDSAQTSIDIAIFDINLGGLVNHIIAKAKTVPVRMLVDRRQAKTDPHSAVAILLRAGIPLRFGTQRGIMHNKFVIVDGRTDHAMMETGSFNQTHGAAYSNNENQIYLASPKVLDRYKKRFEKIWSEGRVVR
jgi:phosphatidylserine/phosphatidylglycerophosphate/cardiolipin synthase-like enzyme